MIVENDHRVTQNFSRELRYQIAMSVYNGALSHIRIFNELDTDFIVQIVPFLKLIEIEEKHIVYKKGDFADEIYFIIDGRVNFLYSGKIVFKTMVKGSYFGEIEIFNQ